MPRSAIRPDKKPGKKPQTITEEIASNPNLYTVEAGSHDSGGFGFEIYKSTDPTRTVSPRKVHQQSGFQNITLAVRALIKFMSDVIEVEGTKFQAVHLTALLRKTTGKKVLSHSIHLRDIMQAVQ